MIGIDISCNIDTYHIIIMLVLVHYNVYHLVEMKYYVKINIIQHIE